MCSQVPGNLSENIRMSLSYADLDMVFEAANFSGTVSGGGTTLSVSGRATAADYRSIGLTSDNDAQSYMLNLYYDFKTIRLLRINFLFLVDNLTLTK